MSSNFIVTDQGHVAIARAIKEQVMHLAWGTTRTKLSNDVNVSAAKSKTKNGTLNVGKYSYCVTIYNEYGETDINGKSISILLDNPNNTIKIGIKDIPAKCGYSIYRVDSSDNDIAKLIYRSDIFKDKSDITFTDTGLPFILPAENPPEINTTGGEWTINPPTASIKSTKLLNEVGRRKADIVAYVTPDPNGEIEGAFQNWSQSTQPTRHVRIRVAFKLTDAPTDVIYQFGLFLNTVSKPEKANERYLLPSDILDPGLLFIASNRKPIYRDALTREIIELIITF